MCAYRMGHIKKSIYMDQILTFVIAFVRVNFLFITYRRCWPCPVASVSRCVSFAGAPAPVSSNDSLTILGQTSLTLSYLFTPCAIRIYFKAPLFSLFFLGFVCICAVLYSSHLPPRSHSKTDKGALGVSKLCSCCTFPLTCVWGFHHDGPRRMGLYRG